MAPPTRSGAPGREEIWKFAGMGVGEAEIEFQKVDGAGVEKFRVVVKGEKAEGKPSANVGEKPSERFLRFASRQLRGSEVEKEKASACFGRNDNSSALSTPKHKVGKVPSSSWCGSAKLNLNPQTQLRRLGHPDFQIHVKLRKLLKRKKKDPGS